MLACSSGKVPRYARDDSVCSVGTACHPEGGARGTFRAAMPLSASYRIDMLHFARQRHRLPCLAGILRAEHLAVVAGADIDLGGIAVVQADRHDRAVHLDLVEALPALAAIGAAIEAAVVAGGGDGERRIERVGLGRRGLHIAAVGGGREAADLHVLPALAAVARAEQA